MLSWLQHFVSSFEARIIRKERLVLYATSFALYQDLPYDAVPRLSNALVRDPALAQGIETAAWSYINDRWAEVLVDLTQG